MKSLLTEQDIKYLLEQQERLDADIRKGHGISDEEWQLMDNAHLLALSCEINEFFNETKAFKYWSKKMMDRQKTLEEAVDVIHFIMLIANKNHVAAFLDEFLDEYETYSKFPESINNIHDVRQVMAEVVGTLSIDNLTYILVDLLAILDFYDFDRKQIMQAYKEKNKVNFDRLAGGY